MANFQDVMLSVVKHGDTYKAHAPENWLQGRTLYGGMSAALALRACELEVPDLPPLRAGQITYIGPSSQDVTLVPTLLRQGKSVTFMGCDLFSEGRLALRACFTFGEARESAYAAVSEGPPAVKAPEQYPHLKGAQSPAFMSNLDQRFAGDYLPLSGAEKGELVVWVRHNQPVENRMTALLALGDALPPASFTRFHKPLVISSATWSFEIFGPELIHADDWVLLRAVDDGLGQGYAGQSMDMWDKNGRLMMKGRQLVTIFG